MTGSAFTLAAPEEESSLRSIEKTIGRPVPRVTLPDFDYQARPSALEVPHAQRIAAIRARKAEERQRAQANAERRAYAERQRSNTSAQPAAARPNRPKPNRHRSSSTVWSTSNPSRRRHRG